MNKQQFYTIFTVLKNPNQSLREICYNEKYYLVPAIILIALAAIFTISMIDEPPDENVSTFEQFGFGFSTNPVDYMVTTIFSFLSSIVFTVIVFLLGKKMGGIGNFKKIFVVMSHAILPVVIGGIIVTGISLVLPYVVSDVSSEEELSSLQHSGTVLYYGVFVPFALWSLALTVIAIKIPNGFGTGKAVGIVLLSVLISYVIWIPANLIFA